MKVIVSSQGKDLDSKISPVFGRAQWFILVDTDDMSHESYENPSTSQSSGAGIMAAQFVLKKDPASVLSANVGPNAFEVLQTGSVSCYIAKSGTVKETVEAFMNKELEKMGSATAKNHAGMPAKSKVGSEEITENVDELEMLTEKLRDLRAQVADILEQLDRISEG
ncbi:MAG: NifB/NifX family molybdenum-iron cluster-binding protein [Candidatus Aegiribacteria sp.]|nr:NifB/NifX family molybdenum-iron cluster-binding protein [Candidatus Aegiribacteria sp.]